VGRFECGLLVKRIVGRTVGNLDCFGFKIPLSMVLGRIVLATFVMDG